MLDVTNIPRLVQWLALWRPGAPLLLDAFCGAGGAAVGYWRAGFNVLGCDNRPQPRYPFPMVEMDAIEFIRQFGPYADAIHASPPCQTYSTTYHLPNVGAYPDLVATTRQVLQDTGRPYVIENVPGAPLQASLSLSGDMFGLRVVRKRLFECRPHIAPPALALQPIIPRTSTKSSRGYSSFARGASHITVAGNNYVPEDGQLAMGIYWMTNRDELSESIPPAYTEYIGAHLRRVIEARRAAESVA